MRLDLHGAGTRFPKPLAAVERGGTVTIRRNGRPAAWPVPVRGPGSVARARGRPTDGGDARRHGAPTLPDAHVLTDDPGPGSARDAPRGVRPVRAPRRPARNSDARPSPRAAPARPCPRAAPARPWRTETMPIAFNQAGVIKGV